MGRKVSRMCEESQMHIWGDTLSGKRFYTLPKNRLLDTFRRCRNPEGVGIQKVFLVKGASKRCFPKAHLEVALEAEKRRKPF